MVDEQSGRTDCMVNELDTLTRCLVWLMGMEIEVLIDI